MSQEQGLEDEHDHPQEGHDRRFEQCRPNSRSGGVRGRSRNAGQFDGREHKGESARGS